MSFDAIADDDALNALRDYLSAEDLSLNDKLPVERDLCSKLGVSRGKLRKALSVLEAEGLVWRHVGRGTFIGPRPVLNLEDVSYLSSRTSPAEVMAVRQAIEPEMARLAALHGTEADFKELHRCNRKCKVAREWPVYEAWDINFHLAIAKATHNKLLSSIFETVNVVRRSIEGKPTRPRRVPADHASFDEHDAIYKAIVTRDPHEAAKCMRDHLKTVHLRFM